MDFILLIGAMILVGVLVGVLAGPIWRGRRPIGTAGDFTVAIVTAIVVGLIDWFVIPAMGFSETLKFLGVALEPAIAAFLVLWLVRKARE